MIGDETSQGLEVEVTGQILPDWQIYAGYTYDLNRVNYGADIGTPIISLAPKHMLRLWTTYQLPGHLQNWTVGGRGSGTVRDLCQRYNAERLR